MRNLLGKINEEHNNPNYNSKQRAAYGQNYIKDPSLARRLLAMTTVSQGDTVLEIGPGEGVFTRAILARAGKLVTIEIDEKNVQHLREAQKQELESGQLEIVHKDALLFESRWSKTLVLDGEYKIVASIPYSISSQLFKKFLLKKPMPHSAWFTVQKEFAQRALGIGGNGLLSVLITSFYEGEILHRFAREDFSPVPNVDSVFMQLIARDDIPHAVIDDFGGYKDFVTRGFDQPIRSVQKHFNGTIEANKLQQLADKHKFKLKELTTDLSARQWQALFAASQLSK